MEEQALKFKNELEIGSTSDRLELNSLRTNDNNIVLPDISSKPMSVSIQ